MNPTHVYTGRLPCGCLVFMVVYDPRNREPTAREVANMIRHGAIIECITWEDYQSNPIKFGDLDDCPHGEVDANGNQQPTLFTDAPDTYRVPGCTCEIVDPWLGLARDTEDCPVHGLEARADKETGS